MPYVQSFDAAFELGSPEILADVLHATSDSFYLHWLRYGLSR